ncbi:ABC transporter ATP-binding protein [Micrococcus sp.]|uniref:energy-coupling factor ABC transporter ATP-binding protein n=1 Tax=Micrococcus sp. TaxID=1271 RepID=UPI002A918CD3|nr:ABC transporter ATP-binding protein [Micrococcus sp.]MDY6054973.1 ABC transporter ATP-binding protein [Micrococcus sp.]
MSTAERAVTLRGVQVTASGPTGEAVLLDGVDLDLTAPRVAVVGENGSGKSTLARAVAGLADVPTGEITVHGVDAVRDVKGLRRVVGMVFANPAAQAVMPTVREDVALTVRSLKDGTGRRLSAQEVTARVDAALAEHRLTALADRACLSLSSGQAQRLAMCAVMSANPSLVVADEPTSLLDGRHRRIIADRLLAADGFQLLLVTHDLPLARACDQAVWIHGGQVERTGPAPEVVDAYEAFLEEAVAEELA